VEIIVWKKKRVGMGSKESIENRPELAAVQSLEDGMK
jgi:hypothetical protein